MPMLAGCGRYDISTHLPTPTYNGIKNARETLYFVFYLVDYIAEVITLQPESVRKLAKAREEALAKIVAGRRRAELDEVDKMFPDQRRKWEEKRRKLKVGEQNASVA